MWNSFPQLTVCFTAGAGRILGMGDVLTLVEKAEAAIKEEDAERMKNKMMANKFDYDDFLEQFKMITNMGPMGQVMKMMPGMSKVTDKQMMAAEKKFSVSAPSAFASQCHSLCYV
jgi:signal recognition particle subunit SRP54